MTAHLREERGFTMIELLVASALTVVVLGGAVALTSQIQNGFRRQIEDSVGEQEARYALEWIGRHLRSAGNNPFPASTITSDCATMPSPFKGLVPGNTSSSITLVSDTNPPDGLIGGDSSGCNQKYEHVTISYDDEAKTITFQDNGTDDSTTTRTDTIIDDLQFAYQDGSGGDITAAQLLADPTLSEDIQYVETRITIRTRTMQSSGEPVTRTLSSTIRVRNR